MKKASNLFIILLFSLTLSQETRGTAKDKGFVKLQIWLKGLGKIYSLKELKNLKKLDLSFKQLKKLPPELGKLKGLKRLDLRENPLSDKEKKKIKKLLPECEIGF